MSEEIKPISEADLDPLDMPMGELDTSFPLLQPDRVYTMMIRTPEIVMTKDGSGEMLVFKLETTKEALDTNDKPLYPGYKFIHRIGLTPSGNRDLTNISKDVGMLAKAVGGEVRKLSFKRFMQEKQVILPLIDSKLVEVKVGIEKGKNGFPDKNNARFIPPVG